MTGSIAARSTLTRFAQDGSGLGVLTGAIGLAALVSWLSAAHPVWLPVWAPWDFSWSEFLAAVLAVGWYLRGVALSPPDERPGIWRQAAFLIGIAGFYAVLLTHFEYVAQHMFFLNRLQHAVMHHFAPFLVALSWPGAMLLRGMPAPLARLFRHPAIGRIMDVIQQPAIAAVLFVGLIYLWLIPPVHFVAMLNPFLYDVMNWSMVIDGILFWCLVLDPRPSPPARISIGARLLVTILVMFPQIAMGARLTFATRSLYSYYDLCGRLLPGINALADQHIGGVIVWIPSAMMSSVAFLLILNHLRMHEDQMPAPPPPREGAPAAVLSSRWTGR